MRCVRHLAVRPCGTCRPGGFFEFVGAFDEAGDHPPGWLRCRLLVHWLGDVHSESIQEVVRPWQEVAALPQPTMPDWAGYLCERFWECRDDVLGSLTDWPVRYQISNRGQLVEWIAAELRTGIARADGVGGPEEIATEPFSDSDVINAGWVARLTPELYLSIAWSTRASSHSTSCGAGQVLVAIWSISIR